MSTTRTITTSFPLGLFCNATLSGPFPEMKSLEIPVPQKKTHRRIEYLSPISLPIEGLDSDLRSDDLSA
jgi:hypothetical protein